MTGDGAYFITPSELCKRLAELGCTGVTKRCLRQWWTKGLLPKPDRRSRGVGGGSGSIRGWDCPDIVTQTYLTKMSMNMLSSIEETKLLLWFAGFEYPVAEMRDVWAGFETRSWRDTISRSFGGLALSEDQFHSSIGMALVSIRDPYIEEYVKAALDPDYPGVEHGQGHAIAMQVLDGLTHGGISESDPADVDALLAPIASLVGRWLEIFNRNFSPVSLKTTLHEGDISDISKAHEDLSFVMGAFRLLCDRALRAGTTGDPSDLGPLEMIRRAGWLAGQKFLLLDRALRRHGEGARVDQSMESIRHLCAQDVVRTGFKSFLDTLQDEALMKAARSRGLTGVPSDPVKFDPDAEVLWDAIGHCWNELGEIWWPRIHAAFPEIQTLLAARTERALGRNL